MDNGFTPDSNYDTTEVELIVYPEVAHWTNQCDRQMQDDEVMVFTISKDKVTAVIKRDCDNLTASDIAANRTEVEAAKFDELKRWHDLSGFQRGPRSSAKNIVDGTWVIKWKMVKGVDASGNTVTRKTIKARLTARGFKDLQAYQENIETFSGTATKSAQRIVNGVTAQHGFVLFSMDISAAFLKGLTFKEIAELTGKPLRRVQFQMPADCIHLLRRLPGLADFNPLVEILEFLKAIWGLKDAPRAFGMRRDQTLRLFGARPTCRDPHLWIKVKTQSDTKTLVAVLSTHLDDIKGGATEFERGQLAIKLQEVFGKDLKSDLRNFEFTGVKHLQRPDHSIYCHQDHYVLELSTIPLDNVEHLGDDTEAPEPETAAFGSLLGGLGWLLVTRQDICAFVAFLQRLARKPLVRHLRMINKVLRYCKKTPAGILYKKLDGKPYLLCVADSAYQANEDKTDCIALRGFFIFLACRPHGVPLSTLGGKVQLIGALVRKLSVVSRSAFAAELRNILEASQDTINEAVLMHDIYRGPLTAEECAHVRDTAGYFIDVVIATDNQGLFNAITKEEPSPGSDGSMAFHVKAVRELLDRRNLSMLVWLDNRDMIADGLTKGKPSREDINEVLASGEWHPQHEYKVWSSSKPRDAEQT